MKRRDFNKIMGGAVAGIVAGSKLFGRTAHAAEGDASPRAGKAENGKAEDKKDVHACKGLNDCKGKGGCATDKHDCAGKNECKGKGGCPSPEARHDCKGMNDCKGMGGCATDKHDCAGQNECKGKGGCKVPVEHKKDDKPQTQPAEKK